MMDTLVTRRKVLGMIGATALVPFPAASQSLDGLAGHAFGTDWAVMGPDLTGLSRLHSNITALFQEVDRDLSPWRADSALSQLNAGPAGAYPASDEMLTITRAAIALASDSRGTFDPTVGPLVARWGFGPIKGDQTPNWLGIETNKNAISKTADHLTLDLCGIAKGRALDRVADLLLNAGQENILIDLGGELLALGQHPSGREWQIAVEHPLSGASPAAMIALPHGKSVATSGVRANSYTLGNQTWSHIIDPHKKLPAMGALKSVSVISDTAMMADGWATALFAAGDVDGPILARKHDVAALFLFERLGILEQIQTGAFSRFRA